MKQICISKPYKVEVREVNPPKISSNDEILVRSVISGISAGTELTLYRGTHPNLRTGKWNYCNSFPIFPGYECVGMVVEKGKDVQDLDLGDRVVCLGSHQEIVKVKGSMAVRLPQSLSAEKALFAVLNTTAAYAVYSVFPRLGDGIIVLGAGVLGLLIFQNCRLTGAGELLIADIDKNRLVWAKELSNDGLLDLSSQDWRRRFSETFPEGADIVMEATGNSEAILTAMEMARKGGKVHIAGFHTEPCSILFGDDFLHKELTLTSSWAIGEKAPYDYRYVRRPPEKNFPLSVRHISEGKIQIMDTWITHRFSFREIKEVYQIIDKKKENFLMILIEWEH